MTTDSSPMDRAQRRFANSLDALEAAVLRRMETDRSLATLETEIRVLSDDRSRLAQDLDKSQGRVVQLESASSDVSGRLDSAIGSIRGLLDTKAAD